ncbi:MAG: NYN domain-containing protein [Clostridia bacterium]|nr:NYN domain-containing protein [Clostridia bacterium]
MGTSNFAVFVDLENVGAKESLLLSIIEKVKIRGDILLGKVYGYTDRYTDLKPVLLSNTFAVVPSLRWGKVQKNNLDIQLVIDAMEVAYTNPLIDSFCIVSGDSDYTPLVGRLKSMGKHVLGISRSEAASSIFVNACNEFVFLESVAKRQPKKAKKEERAIEEDGDINELVATVETIVGDQDEEQMYASELKDTLNRLRPDFSEKSYGCATFGKLVAAITKNSDKLTSWMENSSLMIGLDTEDEDKEQKLDKGNWLPAFEQALSHFKDEGFDRVNPSILKATIQADYPSFEEKQIGFKRFSDVMKALEKKGLLVIEMDDAHTMLLRIC